MSKLLSYVHLSLPHAKSLETTLQSVSNQLRLLNNAVLTKREHSKSESQWQDGLNDILTLYKSLFINYINSKIYIVFDKCLLNSGFTLTTSSDNGNVGLDFTLTCATTYVFDRDDTNICAITGGNTDGTCVLDEVT
jgi:hypothetical protein